MIQKAKELKFTDFVTYEDDLIEVFPELENKGVLHTEDCIVRLGYEWHIGCFQVKDIDEGYGQGLIDSKIGENDIIDEIAFFGCNAGCEETEGIKLNEVKDIIKPDELSLSFNVNKDTSQPERAIRNFLSIHSEHANIGEKRFWEIVFDTAQHFLITEKETGTFNP